MKIILDIPDHKTNFMMELFRSMSFVKAKPIASSVSDEKALFLAEFSDSIYELNDALSEKIEAKDAYNLLDEL